ncbi:site-specific DNA recombinase [Bacillus oleivorans]|uniref:Site-specific DNA recombinase n=1 Tax=Bacillus oleivorans TaxID=1448271 RepID=A0A285CJQ6_9BACI|nr:recombinase family protein [Bacillus oleivorans]SNX67827.1 site-specific DNA recombinase [Bacillus oleivorans]
MKAIYARVSTEEQAIRGYSIGAQIDDCRKKANTDDVLIYTDEGWSGEILERPGLSQLRQDVEEGIIDEVYCYDPDRLARKLLNQLIIDDEFRKKGVKVVFVNGEYDKSPEGKMFFSFRGAISEFEKEKIKQRTRNGKLKKAKDGKIGNYGLYGYNHDRDKKTYTIHPEQSKIVKLIFDYFTNPDSPCQGMNSIAKYLTDHGIPTATGKKIWHRNVVRQILMNEAYTGRYALNKTNSEGDYVRMQLGLSRKQKTRPKEEWIYTEIPRIISDEQYIRAQELLEVARRRYSKKAQNDYLLSGLLRCSDCGNTMVGTKATWWGQKVLMYTDRKNSAGAKNPGCGNQIKIQEVEKFVWENVLSILNNPEKFGEYKKKKKSPTNLINLQKSLTDKINGLQKAKKRLIELVKISDDIDLTDIKNEIADIQQEEKALKIQLDKIKEQTKDKEETEADTQRLRESLNMFFAYKGESIPFEAKQKIIRTLVKQVYLTKDHSEVEIHLF